MDFAPWHRSPLGAQQAPPPPTPRAAQPPEPAALRNGAPGVAGASAEPWKVLTTPPQPAGRAAPVHAAAPIVGTAVAELEPPTALTAIPAGEWPHHQPDARLLGDVPAAAEPAERRLAFVLHAHLPWVLGHGRWPHGEDWLAEAAAHCYLPLVSALRRLAARGGRHLLTVSVSPVLAAQLADPRTPPLVTGYLEHRRDAARELAASHPLAGWWQSTYERLLGEWQAIGGDLLAALRTLADADAIELSTCAATHGYLPLLHRREHVGLQLAAAHHNHSRWFGRAPLGLWMPECAYRPGGPWRHPATGVEEAERPGNEAFLATAGVRWTVVDAHLLLGGDPLAPYPELWGAGDEGSDAPTEAPPLPVGARLQPRHIATSPVAALPREPHTAHQVWSRHGGYPGDPRYLDFHKRHAETGLRLWRVTDAGGDLGDKLPYHPGEAMDAVRDQARHFPELLGGIAGLGGGVAVCPYDAELFGHWWFEGVAWLEAVLERCLGDGPVTTTTPSRELAAHAPAARIALHEGSWGEEGDHRVWVNDATTWMWEDLRRAEEAIDRVLPSLPPERARAALAQLLLMAASDWPFLVTTGTAADYASTRFRLHRDRLHELLAGGDGDALPQWTHEDLAGLEIDPAWWNGEVTAG
ncbi:MAG TPA: 1,4-alpha-glucan branching protein domain-containing protein [Thermoanaerobaculia bacterium]|nr:1,4-alpha-glucan branching protein domain-containing protein [Thermoanaerobaculia bacterium]